MNQNTARIKSFFQDTYTDAQSRITELAERAQSSLEKAQTSLKDGPARGKARLEEVVAQWSVKELIDNLKNHDVFVQGDNLRSDLYGQLGLVSTNDYKALHETLETLQKELSALTTKVSKSTAELGQIKGQLTTLKKKLAKPSSTAKKATSSKAKTKKASAK
jgi:predicted nuclease with TOPRIM domain